MESRLLFIYNPNAGKGKIKNKVSGIVEVLSNAGFDVTIFPTAKKFDAKEKAIEYVTDEKCDRIVCAGGDGTLNEVISGLMLSGKVVPVGYIPSGTTNDWGYSLRIPKNLLEAALLAATGAPFYCDVASINGIYFTYSAAFGLFTDVSYETSQNVKNVLGRSAYILAGISKLANVKSYRITFEYDDTVIEDDFLFGMFANSDSVGGFKGLTGKDVMFDDGLFEMLLIRMPRNVIELNNTVLDLLKGELNTKYLYYARVSNVHFSSKDTLPWALDGEDGGDIHDGEIIIYKQAIPLICRRNEFFEGRNYNESDFIEDSGDFSETLIETEESVKEEA